MKKTLRVMIAFFLITFSFNCFAQQLSWIEVAPGVWKGIVGKPDAYNLLKAAGSAPNTAAIAAITQAGFPFDKADISATVAHNKTYFTFSITERRTVVWVWFEFPNRASERQDTAITCGSLWWQG